MIPERRSAIDAMSAPERAALVRAIAAAALTRALEQIRNESNVDVAVMAADAPQSVSPSATQKPGGAVAAARTGLSRDTRLHSFEMKLDDDHTTNPI